MGKLCYNCNTNPDVTENSNIGLENTFFAKGGEELETLGRVLYVHVLAAGCQWKRDVIKYSHSRYRGADDGRQPQETENRRNVMD